MGYIIKFNSFGLSSQNQGAQVFANRNYLKLAVTNVCNLTSAEGCSSIQIFSKSEHTEKWRSQSGQSAPIITTNTENLSAFRMFKVHKLVEEVGIEIQDKNEHPLSRGCSILHRVAFRAIRNVFWDGEMLDYSRPALSAKLTVATPSKDWDRLEIASESSNSLILCF